MNLSSSGQLDISIQNSNGQLLLYIGNPTPNIINLALVALTMEYENGSSLTQYLRPDQGELSLKFPTIEPGITYLEYSTPVSGVVKAHAEAHYYIASGLTDSQVFNFPPGRKL